jgi:hypothetical protein
MSLYPKVIPCAPQDTMFAGATHKAIIDYTVLASLGAGATLTIQLLPAQTPAEFAAGTAPSGTVPAGTLVRFCGMRLATAFDFSDAAINSLLMEVGDGNDTDRLLTQTETAADGSYVSNKTTAASTQPYAYDAADGIDVKFTAAGGGSPTVQEATSGKVEVFFHLSKYPSLTA